MAILEIRKVQLLESFQKFSFASSRRYKVSFSTVADAFRLQPLIAGCRQMNIRTDYQDRISRENSPTENAIYGLRVALKIEKLRITAWNQSQRLASKRVPSVGMPVWERSKFEQVVRAACTSLYELEEA